MKKILLALALVPCLAAAGDFVTNPSNDLYPDRAQGVVCPFAISNPAKCWTYGNANAVKNALLDLRAGAFGEFSIRAYGAKADGSDDTASIRSAAAAANSAGGGAVIIPCGTYRVKPTPTLWIPVGSNVTVRGMGTCSVLQVDAASGNWEALFGPPTSFSTAVSNVTFRDFAVDMQSQANTTADVRTDNSTSNQIGFLFFAATDIAFDNLDIRNSGGVQAIVVNGTACRGVKVTNSRVTFAPAYRAMGVVGGGYDNTRIYVDASDVTIAGNRIYAPASALTRAVTAIESHSGPSSVTGNVIDGFQTGIGATGVEAANTEIATNAHSITGNTISRASYGILLWAFNGKTHRGTSVSGNVVYLNTADRGAVIPGVVPIGIGTWPNYQATGDFDGITISGNTITSQVDTADDMAGQGYFTSGISLFAFGSVKNATIAGNVVTGMPGFALQATSANGTISNVRIANNVLTNCGRNSNAGAFRGYVYVTGTYADVHVEGNTITDDTGGGTHAIHFAGTGGAGNIARGNPVRYLSGSPTYTNAATTKATMQLTPLEVAEFYPSGGTAGVRAGIVGHLSASPTYFDVTNEQGAVRITSSGSNPVEIGSVVNLLGVLLIAGTGNPEGSIVAPVGSVWLNKGGGATTTLYVKTSGAGNTGWTAK